MLSRKPKWICLLATAAVMTSVSRADGPRLLSMPASIIVFGTYNELSIVTPRGVEKIRPPVNVGYNGGYFIYPSISPNGDLIAWAFACKWEEGRPKNKARFALGIYSIADKQWKTYGDMDGVGNPVFSPDGSKIAFIADQEGGPEVVILDVLKGTMTQLPQVDVIRQKVSAIRSWSADGNRFAIEIQRDGKTMVAVLEISTGHVQDLANGFNPAWSPTGEWVAYFDTSGARCVLIHPDGTGERVVRKLRQSTLSYRRFGWGTPVWSPDGTQLLLDEMKGDGDYGDTVLIDVESGRSTRKATNSLPVFGWARQQN
jgi:Tol biopolymer transport system component